MRRMQGPVWEKNRGCNCYAEEQERPRSLSTSLIYVAGILAPFYVNTQEVCLMSLAPKSSFLSPPSIGVQM
jgi:hypothetical protein